MRTEELQLALNLYVLKGHHTFHQQFIKTHKFNPKFNFWLHMGMHIQIEESMVATVIMRILHMLQK